MLEVHEERAPGLKRINTNKYSPIAQQTACQRIVVILGAAIIDAVAEITPLIFIHLQ